MTPVLIEPTTDPFGAYETRWYVNPPDDGTTYAVERQSWTDDYGVRHIFAWHRSDPR